MAAPPFVAGTLKAPPVRVQSYARAGVFMLVSEDNTGCWTDPEGRVVLPSLEIVDRILAVHGYVREGMVVRPVADLAPAPRCRTCNCMLDNPTDPVGSRDCGGDCLRCMAIAGDPACEAALRELEDSAPPAESIPAPRVNFSPPPPAEPKPFGDIYKEVAASVTPPAKRSKRRK